MQIVQISHLHELYAGIERVVEAEEQQKVLLHRKQLGELTFFLKKEMVNVRFPHNILDVFSIKITPL